MHETIATCSCRTLIFVTENIQFVRKKKEDYYRHRIELIIKLPHTHTQIENTQQCDKRRVNSIAQFKYRYVCE